MQAADLAARIVRERPGLGIIEIDNKTSLCCARKDSSSSFLAPSFFPPLDSALAALGDSEDNMPYMSTTERIILRAVALRK